MTSRFLTDETTLMLVDGGWQLVSPLSYYSEVLGREVVVPRGFFTDLASVPRVMRWVVPVANAKNRRAAIVHDYLCYDWVQKEYGITQRQADEVFREALEVCGVSVVGRWGMWAPVRVYQWTTGLFK